MRAPIYVVYSVKGMFVRIKLTEWEAGWSWRINCSICGGDAKGFIVYFWTALKPHVHLICMCLLVMVNALKFSNHMEVTEAGLAEESPGGVKVVGRFRLHPARG